VSPPVSRPAPSFRLDRHENRSEDELVSELSKLDNVKEGSDASDSASGSLVLKLVDHYVGSYQLSFR